MVKRPGNEFNIVDKSGEYYNVETPEMAPLMMTVSSFDKGPEDFREVSGDTFFKLYGQYIDYEKHGQPAIQAANIIRNGGKLLIKRAVADDAELANVIILATVKKIQVPKTDPITGENIYIDSVTGAETTEASSIHGKNDRVVINTAEIEYSVVSVAGVKSIRELVLAAGDMIVENDPIMDSTTKDPVASGVETLDYEEDGSVPVSDKAGVPSSIPGTIPLPISSLGEEGKQGVYTYPLFIVADNGRGVSAKRFKIVPDYSISKNLKFVLYKLENIGTLDLDNERIRFAADPGTLYNGENMSLDESGKKMLQLQACGYNKGLDMFIDRVSEFSGIEREELVTLDLMFGATNKGESIPQIHVSEEGYDLTSEFGIPLQNGSNGSFGKHPFGSAAYTDKLVKIYSGAEGEDPTIFDVDEWKIEAVVDANYPIEVKQAITELVDFRKDFTFIRDLGLGLESYDAILLASKGLKDSMYAANYCQSYDIVDSFSKRQVPVTICYDIARLLIGHLNNRRNAPFCGELYSVNMPSIVEGSVSYIPRIMPKVDQKQKLYDLHINYATMVNGLLTLETQVNSQTEETQCSWMNNIFVIQNIIRDIRTICPRIRYSFINQSSGLASYANDVNQVLTQHLEEVDSLEFEYSADEMELANHIFNATIIVKFKEYVDYERFTIYVID